MGVLSNSGQIAVGAQGRAYCIGQHRPVRVFWLVTEDAVKEKVRLLLALYYQLSKKGLRFLLLFLDLIYLYTNYGSYVYIEIVLCISRASGRCPPHWPAPPRPSLSAHNRGSVEEKVCATWLGSLCSAQLNNCTSCCGGW